MKETKVSDKLSQTFATARIWCLLSIVAAHVSYPATFAETFWSRLGTVGVPLFLFMAGYFFVPSRFESVWQLIKKKSLTIGVPWLCLGSLTWLYNAIQSSLFRSVEGYFNWMLGNGSYLYYIPVILLCFLLFYKAPKGVLYLALLINVLSVVLTAAGLLDFAVSFLGINHYLNVFNWLGFFTFGMLVQQVDDEKLLVFLRKTKWASIGLFLLTFIGLLLFQNVPFYYFSYFAIPYELLGGWAILSLSTFSLTKISFFARLSGSSFGIYLVHMIFIGLLDRWLGFFEITRLLLPFVIVAVCFLFFLIGRLFSRRIRLEKAYALVTGIRYLSP
ncbi:MAG: acyltransferase [Clostridia bacterium]|nr:acyltransferase [Clostridia bacterium]